MKYAIELNTENPKFSFVTKGQNIPVGYEELSIQEYNSLIKEKKENIHGTYNGTSWIPETSENKTTRESQEVISRAPALEEFDAKVLASYNRLVSNGDITP